ncbi:transcriptional regulator [Haemophilus quentini]|uniref:Positive regulator of the sigma(E) transcription factor n=2 Tax=Haemophilus TaxID=724 RepID=A0A448PY64_HAEPA|nr:putative positive regulator of the sigmaE transcription factor [Haemophilus haemolyticus M21639]NYA48565.1 SoxR reducing system RseC family protein [Haemophilus haemolyticus]OEY75246.1 transcriptional regulator [Haemophilus quentini]VEI29595.1 positive regulator of the sigma(E) transcription factor [Haemophilus parainfluenzae]EGT82473.1 putative positive regulator of the sigmaE transcription factor [Haemophilus haemolyticus M21639]
MSINLNRVQNLIEKLAFISCYISENETIRAILIFMLTALSFVMVKRYTRKLGQQTEFQPILLRVLS